MWLIGTEQQCLNYDAKVTAGENYYNGDNWANPVKHPNLNLWAIQKCTTPRNYEPEYEMQQVEKLNETWQSGTLIV